ncbi:multiheme c-type cytochrome [Tundrisphaera sp. TA3]|uniref:multiheme c-type cytochrome n=1 Tax=Tundrisphaera sp. TA3 TaxID=3435775 RepID=UPI003EB922B2
MPRRWPSRGPGPLSAPIAALIVLGMAGVSARAAEPRTRPATSSDVPARIGGGSCAAKGCHGGVGASDPAHGAVAFQGGEFTTWRTFDPHARAGSVLRDERSRGIAKRLSRRLDGRPAHQAPACLACHAPAASLGPIGGADPDPAAESLRAGVDCEACHGPASRWKDAHLAADWRAKDAGFKAEAGMIDLDAPLARVRSCVGCHVGDRSRGMDVDHDLIAAGHPRLNFEFASYLAAYPKHWREPDSFNEAQAWALGQVAVAWAGVDLLHDRAEAAGADGPGPWPEFSEYACFSCHRELPSTVGGSPGGAHAAGSPLSWATWPLAMLPALDPVRGGAEFAPLRSAMARDEPDPAEVARLARDRSGSLDAWIRALEGERFDAARVDGLIKALEADPFPNPSETWDAATQRYLGLSALGRSRHAPGGAAGSLPGIDPKWLAFPPGFDSPRVVRDPESSAGSNAKAR